MASYNPMTDALPGQSVREIRPAIQPRHIQSNPYRGFDFQGYPYQHGLTSRYHMIAWDVRDPTPGVREWLEAIRPGDVVGVCPMAATIERHINVLERVEVDVYCGS